MYDEWGLLYSSSLPAALPHPDLHIPGYIPKNRNVPQGMWMDEKAFSDGFQWVHGGIGDHISYMQPNHFWNVDISNSDKYCAGAGGFCIIGAVCSIYFINNTIYGRTAERCTKLTTCLKY